VQFAVGRGEEQPQHLGAHLGKDGFEQTHIVCFNHAIVWFNRSIGICGLLAQEIGPAEAVEEAAGGGGEQGEGRRLPPTGA
jgi:hypothetical protein